MKKIFLCILCLFLIILPTFALEGQHRVCFGFMFYKNKNGNVAKVVTITKNSPAWGEILANDEIFEINGINLKDLTQNETLKLLEGEEGTKVKIKLYRNGETIEKELTKKNTFVSDYIEINPKLYLYYPTIAFKDAMVFVWLKSLNAPNKKQEFFNENALYAKQRWGFDCEQRLVSRIEHIEYYKDGSYFQLPPVKSFNNIEWYSIIPNTAGDYAWRLACSMLALDLEARQNEMNSKKEGN